MNLKIQNKTNKCERSLETGLLSHDVGPANTFLLSAASETICLGFGIIKFDNMF